VRVDLVHSTCYDLAGGGPYSRGFIANCGIHCH